MPAEHVAYQLQDLGPEKGVQVLQVFGFRHSGLAVCRVQGFKVYWKRVGLEFRVVQDFRIEGLLCLRSVWVSAFARPGCPTLRTQPSPQTQALEFQI